MARWSLYGYHAGTTWGMTRNRKQALLWAKERGGIVRRMDWPSTTYWDWPTFLVCSELIADFRERQA